MKDRFHTHTNASLTGKDLPADLTEAQLDQDAQRLSRVNSSLGLGHGPAPGLYTSQLIQLPTVGAMSPEEPAPGEDWRIEAHAGILASERKAFEFEPNSKASKRMALRFQKVHGPVLSPETCAALDEMDEERLLLDGRMTMLRAHASEKFPMGELSRDPLVIHTKFAERSIIPLFTWNRSMRPLRTFEVELCHAAERAYLRMLKARIRARVTARRQGSMAHRARDAQQPADGS